MKIELNHIAKLKDGSELLLSDILKMNGKGDLLL